MGKDRQQKKLKQERRVESDRNTETHPKGSSYTEDTNNSNNRLSK
ncbi:YpzI family protein [Pontibacillus salicampi]|uniref:YpzI family protein n=1 Tax=Pontibacillus salicampi TaxID=1449801 RepID=A0ABV6LLH5_9BACI